MCIKYLAKSRDPVQLAQTGNHLLFTFVRIRKLNNSTIFRYMRIRYLYLYNGLTDYTFWCTEQLKITCISKIRVVLMKFFTRKKKYIYNYLITSIVTGTYLNRGWRSTLSHFYIDPDGVTVFARFRSKSDKPMVISFCLVYIFILHVQKTNPHKLKLIQAWNYRTQKKEQNST